MYCTFAVPSLWSFRGLTGNYTCTHPAEGITYPHVTSIHADADFFSITCLDEVDNSCMMQSLGFWESLGVTVPVVKCHIPSYGNVPDCSYFRGRCPAEFCAVSWYWHWYCGGHVIWGLKLQFRTGMKRQVWIFPSVRSIPPVHAAWAGAWLLCCPSECVSHLLSCISLSSSKAGCFQQPCWACHPSWVAQAAQDCPSRSFPAN